MGCGGRPQNGFFSTIVTDVTDLYDSKIPLVASSKMSHNEDWQETAEHNKHEFLNTRTWRVSQYKGTIWERVGIMGFKLVRMDMFNELWRKPIVVSEYNMKYQKHSNVFEIQGKNMGWSDDQGFQLIMRDTIDTLDWLYKYKPMVYIFSDKDRMFVNPEDELAFIADVLNSEE